MQLSRFLDVALSSAAKVKVLRRLALDSKPASCRAVARAVGMSHAQVLRIMQELHSDGILRLEQVGRSHAYTLQKDATPVKSILLPLFQKERSLPDEVAREIAASVRIPTLSVSTFGSVAKGTDHPESDLDMIFIVQSAKQRSTLEAELAGDVGDRSASMGVRLGPFVITVAEAQKRFRRR